MLNKKHRVLCCRNLTLSFWQSKIKVDYNLIYLNYERKRTAPFNSNHYYSQCFNNNHWHFGFFILLFRCKPAKSRGRAEDFGTNAVISNVSVNVPQKTDVQAEAPEVEPKFQTEVIIFKPPEVLPAEIKDGQCQLASIAQPYRQDAFRCLVLNKFYDPCFAVSDDVVYCKMNPLEQGNDFLIMLEEPVLPPVLPGIIKDNWAWFVELEDGTYCAPYTGAKPIIEGSQAYYGCKSNIQGQQVFLLGDLIKNSIWIAKTAIVIKEGGNSTVKSLEDSEIKRVWQ